MLRWSDEAGLQQPRDGLQQRRDDMNPAMVGRRYNSRAISPVIGHVSILTSPQGPSSFS